MVSRGKEVDTLKNPTKDTIQIETVTVNRQVVTPEQKFNQKKEEYRLIYFWGDTKDMLSISNGLALNVNKLYNKFSKQGRNARRLQRVFEREYLQDIVLEKWLPLTEEYTDLQHDSLTIFRVYYQPNINWIRDFDEYERIAYIVTSLKNYRDSADYIHQMMLIP
ncbi:MAG TPA: hypothetical protein VKZ57_01365 [Sphingobacterium sp.]|nr:hypothetical protein [Sphingobacterium sp.]